MKMYRKKMRRAFLALPVVVVTALPLCAAAQEPSLPPPLKNLVEEGAQIRYLGKDHGLDGWIAIRNGQEQYFYVTSDGQALLMGVLFDRDGKLVTARQVRELQEKSGEVLDLFAEKAPEDSPLSIEAARKRVAPEFKTPAEQMFDEVSHSNWIRLGEETAPVIYSFMDPQCPHCHAFMEDLKKNYIDNGLVQVRMIPVGLREETKAQAAFLLAAPDAENLWFRHLAGEKGVLPVEKGINEQGVERNLAVMQSWKLDATPLTVYRDKSGRVKILRGRPRKVTDIVTDLPSVVR